MGSMLPYMEYMDPMGYSWRTWIDKINFSVEFEKSIRIGWNLNDLYVYMCIMYIYIYTHVASHCFTIKTYKYFNLE